MSASQSRFSISPEDAVRKFLVDMRVAAERAFRTWKGALLDGFDATTFTAPERDELLKPHPLEDYFSAALIGLQAAGARPVFTPTVTEALLRQIALQVDEAVGRQDRMISTMVFLMLGRIRKNMDLGLNARPEDVVCDVVLERLTIDRMSATRHLMQSLRFRYALSVPLISRPIWWQAFDELYSVEVVPLAPIRRPPLSPRLAHALDDTGGGALHAAAPRALPSLAAKLGAWLTPRPHLHS